MNNVTRVPSTGENWGEHFGSEPATIAQIRIDLSAITDNVRKIAQIVSPAQVMAVVKADAYGHGLIPSAQAAQRGGATYLGVAQITEAFQLREAQISGGILAWLHHPESDFGRAITEHIDLGISSVESLQHVIAAAEETGKAARIHLKVDTGLARNGAFGRQWDELLTAVAAAEKQGLVHTIGIMTHFAYADAPNHPTVIAQEKLFAEAVAQAEIAGIHPELRHMSNSAAALTRPSAAWNMVRPGIAVYGISPIPGNKEVAAIGLRPAMRLETRVAGSKTLPPGQGVSYGHTFITSKSTCAALIPLGYADGIPRHASNAGRVLLRGEQRPILGRVCMDQFMVDCGFAEVSLGEPAIIFGDGSSGEPTAEDWAQASGTIAYEIITRLSARLPRIYLQSEKE